MIQHGLAEIQAELKIRRAILCLARGQSNYASPRGNEHVCANGEARAVAAALGEESVLQAEIKIPNAVGAARGKWKILDVHGLRARNWQDPVDSVAEKWVCGREVKAQLPWRIYVSVAMRVELSDEGHPVGDAVAEAPAEFEHGHTSRVTREFIAAGLKAVPSTRERVSSLHSEQPEPAGCRSHGR